MRSTTLLAALLLASIAHGQTDADTKPSALGVSEGDLVYRFRITVRHVQSEHLSPH